MVEARAGYRGKTSRLEYGTVRVIAGQAEATKKRAQYQREDWRSSPAHPAPQELLAGTQGVP